MKTTLIAMPQISVPKPLVRGLRATRFDGRLVASGARSGWTLSLQVAASVAMLALSGCYRSVTLRPHELKHMQLEQSSATIEYDNGDTRRIHEFDSLTVRATGPAIGIEPADPFSLDDDAVYDYEFEGAVSGSLQPPVLHLDDAQNHARFALANVHEITIERFAPDRPLWVLAAAGVGAMAGGLIGAAAGASSDNGGEFHGVGKFIGLVVGVPLGFITGLIIGVPLTDDLGEISAPAAGHARIGVDPPRAPITQPRGTVGR